jgi:CRP-like cAMP-binding protein
MDSTVNLQPVATQALLKLGELSHQLQLERGCTALYVDSEGEIYCDELREQRKITDDAIAHLGYVMQNPALSTSINDASVQKIQDVIDVCNALKAHRKKVDRFEYSFARSVNTYTYSALSLILDLQIEIALFIAHKAPTEATAYANLLQWKERVGRERAWGAHGFCSKVFKNREFTERMLTLIDEQGAYKRAFLSLTSEPQRALVEKITSGYVMQFVDDMHDMLQSDDRASELENISPITWFQLLTGKVERLKLVEIELVQTLSGLSFATEHPAPAPLATTRLERYMPLIRALPAFSKLDEEELHTLLNLANVQECEKGKLLFLQSEPLSRFYLILSGWVKLFKGSDTGEEAVLQMLSAGDSVMEAAVLLNIPSAASAQIVENAVLLSLPAPVVRQVLQDNNAFALNMIGSLSMRSQHLIQQIEHSRLKNASERVGWYLLKLGVEEGSENTTAIHLPYDKSLIASYLDMTPETFSRTLKKFRAQGFRIENDTITQPHPKALCSYCDENLSHACRFKDAPECPGTYL